MGYGHTLFYVISSMWGATMRQNIKLNNKVNRNSVVVAERGLVHFTENVANNNKTEDRKERTNEL